MCKFLVLENQNNAISQPETFEEKVQRANILEIENKQLEDSLIKKIGQQKNTNVTKSHKLEELLNKLKKLDEIAFNLEEKNKTNEHFIKKQNRKFKELKDKHEKIIKENQEIKEQNVKLENKIKELEKNLEEKTRENDYFKEIVRQSKQSEYATEDLELNQSISSDFDLFRNSLKSEQKARAMTNTSLVKMNCRKYTSTAPQDFEDNDENISIYSEKKNYAPADRNMTDFMKQLEYAKKNSKGILRKTFLHYQQIKLKKKMALEKLF